MSEPSRAVFLSYASQDAEAAQRLCDALRAAGVEVWFDRNELVGGDAWDQKIRRQIKECALFVPIISPNTNARAEGYFRLEWKLAVDRSHLMADDAPFLFPVVLGGLTEATARVPEKFKEVQWTPLRAEDSGAELARRLSRLLGQAEEQPIHSASAKAPRVTAAPAREAKLRRGWIAGGAAGLVVVAGALWFVRDGKQAVPASPASESPAAVAPVAVAPGSGSRAVSEARRLADQAFVLSVDKYDSTLDDYTTADALMKKAVALDGDDGEVLARSAQLQFMFRNRGFDFDAGRISLGRTQAERAVRLAPNSPEAQLALSLSLRYTGNLEASIDPLRRAVELAPNHPRALIWLGSRLFDLGKREEGQALLDRARVNAHWAPLVDYYGFLSNFGARRFAEAERFLRSSYGATPSANTAGGIALLHLTWTGDLDRAAQELAAIPPILLNAPRVVWLSAQVHLNRRSPEDALRALDRLPDEFIRDSWFTGPKSLLVGRAHALAGRTQAARLAWERGLQFVDEALKSNASDAGVRRARAELLALLGRTDEALAEAKTFEELTRGNVRAWNLSTAGTYAALGRADLAVPKLAAALDSPEIGWPLTRTLLRLDPRWDPIRKDPAFAALLVEPEASAAPAPAANEKSIAVLAFANLSDDKANEYFADGISEELITTLGGMPGLTVRGRTSTFHFKGRNATSAELGRELDVKYLVRGSVRRAGERVRVTAQLTRAADDAIVWSSPALDRDVKDIFAVQAEVAQLIAEALSVKLGVATAPAKGKVEIDPESYRLFYEGRKALELRTPEGFDRAEALFSQVIERRPTFARAYVARADTRLLRWQVTAQLGLWSQRSSPLFAVVRDDVERALKLEPDLAEAFASRGLLASYAWDLAGSVRDLQKAIELNPNYAPARQWLGIQYWSDGRIEEARRELTRAVELEPLSATIASACSALEYSIGNYPKALVLAQRAMAINPKSPRAFSAQVVALAANGQVKEAADLIASRGEEDFWDRGRVMAVLLRVQGREKVEAAFERNRGRMPLRVVAESLAVLGRWDEFFAVWGPDAINPTAASALFDATFDPVRKDPRFQRVFAEVGMAEAHARIEAWRAAHPPVLPEGKR
jgi:TolB-like protein/Flp pilus assembly protein TadD